MAGFFGLFNYTKPGKGVRKDEPQKGRLAHFFQLFFRKFWQLAQLNLLFVLFCVPVVTIGPACAGMTYVLRNMAGEKPVFLFSDFWDAFKDNWKQAFAYSVFWAVCAFLVVLSLQFYLLNVETFRWMILPAALSLGFGLLLTLMSYYAVLMIVTLDLPLGAILKNAAILSLVCLRTNLLTLLFTGLLLAATALVFPLSLLLVLFFIPAWVGFIICYNSYPGIEKYAVIPHTPQGGGEEERTLFSDDEPGPNM